MPFVNRINRINIISNLIIGFLAIFIIYPPLKAIPFFDELWLILMIIWYVLNITKYPVFFFKTSRLNIIILFFVMYTVLISYMFENYSLGNRFLEISLMYLFFFSYELNNYLGLYRKNLKIVKYLIPFVILTSISTIYAYQINPYISRSIKRSSETLVDSLQSGVGGYEFIYFLVIICSLLLSILIHVKKIKVRNKILIFLGFLLLSYNIVLSNFSTALILLIFGSLLLLVINKVKSYRTFFLILIFLPTIFLADDILPKFFNSLSGFFGDNMNALRMAELSQFTSSYNQGTSIEERFYMYNVSLDVIINNPLFGIIYKNLNSAEGVIGFGQHSHILDFFALFGLFIGVMQLYIFIKPFVQRFRTKIFNLNKLNFVVFSQFIFLSFFNNITPSVGLAVFFIYPTIYEWIKEVSKNKIIKK